MWFLNQRTEQARPKQALAEQTTPAPVPSSDDCDGVLGFIKFALLSFALCLLIVLAAAAGSPVPDTLDRKRQEEAERIIAEEMQRPVNRAASVFSSQTDASFVTGFGGSK